MVTYCCHGYVTYGYILSEKADCKAKNAKDYIKHTFVNKKSGNTKIVYSKRTDLGEICRLFSLE